MVVEHGERMAAAAAEQGEVALEVHLPQFVGGLTFEALERALSGRGGGVEQPRAAQNAGYGARRHAGPPWRARKRASLRPPHELRDSCRSRTTACSTSVAVRAGLRRGRLERSSRPLAPACAYRSSHL